VLANTIREVSAINNILNLYDAFIIDIWGVIYDGTLPYEGTAECVNKMLEQNKAVIFLSNTPRPSHITTKRLQEWGIKITPEMVLTSGDAVRDQLIHRNDEIFKALNGNILYHIGAERNQDILSGFDESIVKVSDILEEANFLLLTAYLDEGEDIEQFSIQLKQAQKLNLPAICANPDKIIPNGDKKRYCAGFYAEQYTQMGGKVYYYGKPDSKVFELAYQPLQDRH
jgi:HAD superfamily hydrolase (TIGR01459 family)